MIESVRPHRREAITFTIGSFIGGALEAALLVVITRAGLAIADGRSSFGVLSGRSASIEVALLVAAGLLVARLAVAVVVVHTSAQLSAQVLTSYRSNMESAFLRASWAVQQSNPPSKLQELLVSYAGAASGAVSSVLGMASGLLNLIALVVVSLLVNPLATASVALALALLGALLAPVRARIHTRARAAADAQMAFANTVAEYGALGLEMQTFGVRDQFAARVDELIEADADAKRRAAFVQGILSPTYTAFAYAALIGGLVFAAAIDARELGGAAAVMLVMLRALSYAEQAQTALGSVTATLPYLETADEAIDFYRAHPARSGDLRIDSIGTISADHVSYSYDEHDAAVQDISVDIGPGEVLGIIGPSGSGKSTFVQLLLGLRAPSAGTIAVDGIDLQRIDPDTWTSLVSFVGQEPLLMTGTIAENIRFFRPELDDATVRDAARRAHILDEIDAMADGFGTPVGARGGSLSGGQRQRIAIARALVGRPSVLVLDEPTSALDGPSEALIRQTLAELKDSTTIVIIAHRLSTLDACDRLMVIIGGQCVAAGPPEVLARDDGFYSDALRIARLS